MLWGEVKGQTIGLKPAPTMDPSSRTPPGPMLFERVLRPPAAPSRLPTLNEAPVIEFSLFASAEVLEDGVYAKDFRVRRVL